MTDEFRNVYDDGARAESYAGLEFPGTYYLAYRDLPTIIGEHVRGVRALDFGCGTGRSTRFLRGLGFHPLGVDISAPMLDRARERDPGGSYQLVPDGDLGSLAAGAFDLVLAVFTFDNIPTAEVKRALLGALLRSLAPGGRIVLVVSAPEIYVNEWASFSTRDFPENRGARSGDSVRIVMLDVDDRRPVHDVVFSDDSYRAIFAEAGLRVRQAYSPLGDEREPFDWVSETRIAPWTVYVLEGG